MAIRENGTGPSEMQTPRLGARFDFVSRFFFHFLRFFFVELPEELIRLETASQSRPDRNWVRVLLRSQSRTSPWQQQRSNVNNRQAPESTASSETRDFAPYSRAERT